MPSQLMRLLLFAILTALPVVGKPAKATSQAPIKTSVCELVAHPDWYDGKVVTLHGRLSVNWESGEWIHDGRCKGAVRLGLPGSFWIPSRYSHLQVTHDDGFREFDKAANMLCNGMQPFCDFDYLEAHFTGTFIASHRLQMPLSQKLPPSSAVVITKVTDAKLHANGGSMLQSAPVPVPNVIPESE